MCFSDKHRKLKAVLAIIVLVIWGPSAPVRGRFAANPLGMSARSPQDVVSVEVLMEQDLFALRASQSGESIHRSIEQLFLKAAFCALPLYRQLLCPVRRFNIKRPEGCVGLDPEPGQ